MHYIMYSVNMNCFVAVLAAFGVLMWPNDANAVTNDTKAVCYNPFTAIGDRCLLVESHTKGNWYEMRDFCSIMNGDLLKIDDANLLNDIVLYINSEIGESTDYWVGASDDGHEGLWLWTDGSLVTLGVPLWYHCSSVAIQPDGGGSQNCAALRWGSFYHMHDESCYTTRAVICENRR